MARAKGRGRTSQSPLLEGGKMEEKIEEIKEEVKEVKEVKETLETKREEELKKYEDLKNAMYWFYFGCGEKRSLHRVAIHFAVKDWVIKDISIKDDWVKKVSEGEKLLQSAEPDSENKLLEYFDLVQYGIITDILKDPLAKTNDKLKAAEMLDDIAKRSADIRQKKKLIIEFPKEEEFKNLIQGIRNFETKS